MPTACRAAPTTRTRTLLPDSHSSRPRDLGPPRRGPASSSTVRATPMRLSPRRRSVPPKRPAQPWRCMTIRSGKSTRSTRRIRRKDIWGTALPFKALWRGARFTLLLSRCFPKSDFPIFARTDRDRLEESLRGSNRATVEASSIIELTPGNGVGWIRLRDRDFRILRINAMLASANGGKAEDQIGRRVEDVVPALWPTLEPIYRRVIDRGDAVVDQGGVGPDRHGPGSDPLVAHEPESGQGRR